MSNHDNKIKAAQRLFDAIGEIDDSIIKDAENTCFSCSRTLHNTRFTRVVTTAAVILVLCVGMVGGFIVGNLRGPQDGMTNSSDEDVNVITQTDNLKNVLLDACETDAAEIITLDAIDFFDGEVSVIWKYDGENDYYKLVLGKTKNDAAIRNKVSGVNKQIDEETAISLGVSVWVSYGNGEVVSPYLKTSNGNVGYAELFDYSPEIVPNDDFVQFVKNTISNS